MACTSDGKKSGPRKTTKTRHHSLGSISSEEINSIIGVNLNTKKEQIRTYLDKPHSIKSNKNKQGNSESVVKVNDPPKANIQDQQKVENVADKDIDDVFKPKNVVNRTPEKENIMYSDQFEPVTGTAKRNRSEPSPEHHAHKKIHLSDSYEKETQEMDFKEDIILEMFNNLDIINNVTNSTELPQSDQSALREAHTNLHKLITRLVFQYSSLEKTNIELKHQAQNIDICKEPDQHKSKMGYADITKMTKQPEKKANENNIIATNSQNTQWKTPPTVKKKHETIIQIKNVHDPNDAIQKFKTEIKNKEIGKGFKSIQQTKNGAIIVESFDKKQQEMLKTVLNNNNNFKMKESGEVNPMFMVTGINKGFSNADFLEELQNLNSEIVEELGYSVTDKIEIVTKKQCRNPTKENWILQAPPQIAKWFLKRGTIFFDLVRVYVQEYFNLAICFKCSGYSHVAKYCTEKECCHKCGGQHFGKDCETEELKCPNCSKLKLQDLNHSARSRHCPVYIRKLERFKTNITYTYKKKRCSPRLNSGALTIYFVY